MERAEMCRPRAAPEPIRAAPAPLSLRGRGRGRKHTENCRRRGIESSGQSAMSRRSRSIEFSPPQALSISREVSVSPLATRGVSRNVAPASLRGFGGRCGSHRGGVSALLPGNLGDLLFEIENLLRKDVDLAFCSSIFCGASSMLLRVVTGGMRYGIRANHRRENHGV